jgi:hypothetical protein
MQTVEGILIIHKGQSQLLSSICNLEPKIDNRIFYCDLKMLQSSTLHSLFSTHLSDAKLRLYKCLVSCILNPRKMTIRLIA